MINGEVNRAILKGLNIPESVDINIRLGAKVKKCNQSKGGKS